jgi:DNA topoisomerase I
MHFARRSCNIQGMAKQTTPDVSIIIDPHDAAKAAHLRYVTDADPGITRQRHGKGFSYLGANGKPVSAAERKRIDALVIPPAWEDVWICPSPNGHLLATGRDQKGRKQYLYHPRWREVRDETKFNRMILFGETLPKIRKSTSQHLTQDGLPREKVLAAAVRVMEQTMIRVGNAEYTRDNESYGLTTLLDKHARIKGAHVTLAFRGKSGKDQTVDFSDKRLARIIRQVKDLPGYELFQYVDEDGTTQDVGSEDVNDYLREITGEDFTAKDFRTWGGTVLALTSLLEMSEDGKKPKAPAIVKRVAQTLGNTRAVCKKYYIHPSVLKCCEDVDLYDKARTAMDDAKADKSPNGLTREEAATIAFLRMCAAEN